MCGRSARLGSSGAIVLASLGAIWPARIAYAQREAPRNYAPIFQRRVPAPNHALELGLAAGYDQGVGGFGGAPAHVQDIAGVGAGADVSVAYRFSPLVSVGAYGSGAFYTDVVPNADAKSLAIGARAAWHFRPYRSLDPWISMGSGYRTFYDSLRGGGSTVRKAVQLVAVGIGVDYRLSPEFGIGPFIGADLSLFFREDPPGQPSFSVNALSSFVSAGVAARFDILGEALHPARDIASVMR
jgi:hypothetical protein